MSHADLRREGARARQGIGTAGAARLLIAIAICLVTAGCGGSDDVHRGKVVITQQACGSCHRIAGIQEANGTVGPSLSHFGSQRLIAGVLVNDPQNLARFLRSPGTYVRNGAMPEQVLDEGRLRAAAAYLETLR